MPPENARSEASIPPTRTGARKVWWLIAAGALAGALSEMAVILGARVVLHRYTLLNPQGVWLAPIANALLLSPVLFVIWIVMRRATPQRAFSVTTGVAAAFAVLEPLLVLKERVHIAALLLLAVGAGVQFAQLASRRPEFFGRLLRRGTITLATIATVCALGFNAGRAMLERRALASLPTAPEGAPNVILLVLDTVRALSLSAYGYDRDTTPFLSRLSADGVRFDRAISTAPWSLTSHATMFTGRYPHELSAGWSVPLDDAAPTLAERLSKLGYATAGVAANLRYCSYEFGLSRGFGYYRDYDVSVSELFRTSSIVRELVMAVTTRLGITVTPGRQWGDRINERFLSWIDQRQKGRPFFAFLNYYDAHAPYAPPAPYDTLYLGRQAALRDPAQPALKPNEVSDLKAAYEASIRYLDDQLRALHDSLQARGELKNTVIIVTSDHGEEFNEHGIMDHGNSLYFPSVFVPLVLSYPQKIPAGTVVRQPVTLRDLAATIQELVRMPDSLALPGHSLSGHWQRADSSLAERSPRLAEVDFARNLPGSFAVSKGDMQSLAIDGIRYIRRGDGHEEFYDIVSDPLEQRELSADSARRPLFETLRDSTHALTSKRPRIP